ncbi:MAG TPA: hypothetical protein DCM40_33460 [Maribacter sp.]|nr:hypothetical protein [Maribacter sp.]
MKHTFTRDQVKKIILEELEKSKIDDAAEEIVDELDGLLSEAEGDSFFEKAYNRIFKKSQEENLDPDELAIQTYKRMRAIERFKKILAGVTLATFLGGFMVYIDIQSDMGAQADAAEKTTQQALQNIESQKSTDALEQLKDKLGISVLYSWTLDSGKGDEASGKFITGTQSNFPMFQDYNAGTVQIFSPEYGVVMKLKDDIQKQIDRGVANKKDLKPMISDVKVPTMSKQEYAKIYKQLYDIPDFNPANVDEEDIGGNIDKVRKKSQGGIKFLKAGRGQTYAYETYQLSDFINAELPNETGLSPSQFYMKLFNEVTGQNIQL